MRAAAWAVQFDNQAGRIKCYAVVAGCLLARGGRRRRPGAAEAGDCFVLPCGRPFRLGGDPSCAAAASDRGFAPARRTAASSPNGGGDDLPGRQPLRR